jgi:hypothetical protein
MILNFVKKIYTLDDMDDRNYFLLVTIGVNDSNITNIPIFMYILYTIW